MTTRMIPLSELVPDPADLARAARYYARCASLDALQRSTQASGSINAEVLVDMLDADDPAMVAAAVRMLVAHVRAGRARWHQLDRKSQEAGR